MRRRMIFAGLALATCLATACSEVFAQGFSITITVDENGNGSFTNTAGFKATLTGSLLTDSGPGGLLAALTYNLLNPPGLVAGDLLLLEPGGIGGLSDLIRFNSNQNGGSLVLYSDTSDLTDSRADTGFPTALYTNNLAFLEAGPEGNNGFTYTPTAGQPGFITGAAGPVSYVLRSDIAAVPEPGSIILGGIGISIVLASAYVRRGRVAA